MSVFLLTRSLQRADHGLLTDIAEGGLPEVIGSLSVAGDKSEVHRTSTRAIPSDGFAMCELRPENQ